MIKLLSLLKEIQVRDKQDLINILSMAATDNHNVKDKCIAGIDKLNWVDYDIVYRNISSEINTEPNVDLMVAHKIIDGYNKMHK